MHGRHPEKRRSRRFGAPADTRRSGECGECGEYGKYGKYGKYGGELIASGVVA